ncbi:MAG: ATP-binding cassette domain-containing protein [Deltaproteobacteria bacterium]|nr:ATP-binding cassette domain-containing protein [Deltaproteobacteria bacterium]
MNTPLPNADQLGTLKVGELQDRYPFAEGFFSSEGFEVLDDLEFSLDEALTRIAHERDEAPTWREGVLARLHVFIAEMLDFVTEEEEHIEKITVRGGRAKDGSAEPVAELTLSVGDVVCLVGPTGSGKSRLLADIEWVAQGDTPTGRQVLVNGAPPDRKWRFSSEHKLVAQLSQNMNFVMDLSVEEFVTLHAESRRAENIPELVQRIWHHGNELCGEPFALDTPVTSLSGGQSRALMIADVAMLSSSPIVLIDEIENAGIDRKRALEVLLAGNKIVLMATHDPILALYGDRRVVLKNGAMQQVITPTPKERENLTELQALDAKLMELRHRLRSGELLEEI